MAQKGPLPIQLVVVMAVKNAVSAATTTFAAISIIRFFIIVNYQFSIINCAAYSFSGVPPLLLVKVLLATSLLWPSLMAIAFTVAVSLRVNASL